MNIAEIARRANVSTATVSRTLNQSGPVKAATARKVWRAVAALNYYPNSHARALVSGRSRLTGLIVSDITNPFFPELIRSFEGMAARHSCDLIVTSTDYQTTRMSHVALDYGHGMRQAVDHLVGLGHKHIAFISGPLDLHSARTRRQAFLEGMRHHGLRPAPNLLLDGTHTAEGGSQAMAALLRLSKPPTAVVASNDWTAIGALHAIHAAGKRVPEDISLVGFDDIPLVSYTIPPLTSVRMAAADVGATAFEALFGLIDGERFEGAVYQVPTKLVVRDSTLPLGRRG